MKFLSSLLGFPKVPRQDAGSTGNSQRSAAGSSTTTRDPEYQRKFRTAFGWVAPVGRLLPPYSDKLPLPPGYVRLADAWKIVYVEAGRWGVPLDWGDLHLRNSVARRIGEAAARGEVRIAGFMAGSSVAYWFPREVWTAPTVIGGRVAYPSYVASQGGLVRLGIGPAGSPCQPFMRLRDLATVLDAVDLPLPPPPNGMAINEPPTLEHDMACGAGEPNGVEVVSPTRTVRTSATAMPNAAPPTIIGEVAATRTPEPFPPTAASRPEDVSSIMELPPQRRPGRPSSMMLVEAEMRRRAQAGRLRETIASEARYLATWLKKEHPDEPPLSAKTIANVQCHPYNELLSSTLAISGQALIQKCGSEAM